MPHSSVHATRRRLVVATGNSGKLRELRSLLAGMAFDLESLGDLGVSPPLETGATFAQNALLKARHAAAASGDVRGASPAWAIADDSGLEVDALDGAPGIFSARYAGAGASDAANNAKLIADLRGVPLGRRQARYRCVLAFLDAAQNTDPLIVEGVWEGYIVDAARGSGGFGYDAHFWLPELSMTAAQLDPAQKNRLSHRGRAIRTLRDQLSARDLPVRA